VALYTTNSLCQEGDAVAVVELNNGTTPKAVGAPGRQPGNARLLVVDDDEFIADVLASGLRFAGFDVDVAGTGREALNRLAVSSPDLIVLDVMLPDFDGFELLGRLRRDGIRTPVILLTARGTTSDRVSGLRLGADDYISKPFSLEEVAARVEAVLRRVAGSPRQVRRLTVDDLLLDEDAHSVSRAGSVLEVSPTEFNVLRFLMVNAGRVVSKAQILDGVWGYDLGGESTVVETYISYLRKKIDALGHPLIHTVRSVGYVMRVP
jgi:two-component system OmpR family response regulator